MHGKDRESEKTPGKPLKRKCQTTRREAKQEKERDNEGTHGKARENKGKPEQARESKSGGVQLQQIYSSS